MGTLLKTKKIWTESSIQKTLIERFMSESNIKYICENLFIFKGWESDLILITKSNYVYEFEIKISKNDFKNDFKNKRKKHLILEENKEKEKKPNYFYYAVPEGLIAEEEIPDYAGLVYLTDIFPYFKIIKSAPKLDSHKYTDEDLNLTEKFYYNYRDNKQKVEDKNNEIVNIKQLIDEEIHKPDNKKQSYIDLVTINKKLKEEIKELNEKNNSLKNDNSRLLLEIKEIAHDYRKEIFKLKDKIKEYGKTNN